MGNHFTFDKKAFPRGIKLRIIKSIDSGGAERSGGSSPASHFIDEETEAGVEGLAFHWLLEA